MFKPVVFSAALSLLAIAPLHAHHSYAEYFRDQKVSIEGTLEQLTLGNPHGILMVRTDDGTLVTAEWGNAIQLNRSGFVAGMLSVGDRVVVTGSPSRNPESHRVALVSMIRRLRDGWNWTKLGVVAGSSAP